MVKQAEKAKTIAKFYEVIRGDEKIGRPGVFHFYIPAFSYSGFSRVPLLDACRAIKSMGGETAYEARLFREGHEEWDIRVKSVKKGAGLAIDERNAGDGPILVKYRHFPRLDQSMEHKHGKTRR